MDPGAVPGASTIIRGWTVPPGDWSALRTNGGETGSTRVVKTRLSLGIVPPLSGSITNANDNHEAFAIAA